MTTAPLKPDVLRHGDLIGIITPASQMVAEKLHAGINYLKTKGYGVILGNHVYDSYGYLAGKDEDRVDDLHFMFSNPEVKAIISSRGGYGTPRLLDLLDYGLIARNPKIFIGYSDLTSLQLAFWKHTGLVSFSGPMVAVEMAKKIDPFSEKNLWSLICDNHPNGFVFNNDNQEFEVLKPGRSHGILMGGCLSLVTSIIGTAHQPDFDKTILILEDIGEQPYRIDRYLSQLRSAGIFNQVNGIILSQFVDCNDKKGDPTLTLDEIFSDYFDSLSFPVIKNFLYGHIPRKFTIPIGIEVEIDTYKNVVRSLEPAVKNSTE